jgi:crotonobetainyl-CoA:carnitine CoA-transferase CaiB-like acyl-CoA transferase
VRADGTRDDERWIAIAVLDDAQWRGLAGVLASDGETFAADRALATLAGRESRAAAIDAGLARWSRARRAEDLVDRLQAAGVPAAVVASGEDLCRRDPQLAARGYFRTVRTVEGREVTVDALPLPPGAVGSDVLAPGPLLGEHTDVILREILGMDAAEIATLREQGVVE